MVAQACGSIFSAVDSWVLAVQAAEERAQETKQRYLDTVGIVPSARAILELAKIDDGIDRARRQREAWPDGLAWTPLDDRARGFLHRAIADDRRTTVYNDQPTLADPLRFLRTNLACGRNQVSPALFRLSLMKAVRIGLDYVLGSTQRGLTRRTAVMVALRTGVFPAEVYHEYGVRRFWPIDVQRDKVGRPIVGRSFAPPEDIEDWQVVIPDPLLATGGSQDVCIRTALAAGVKPGNITVHALVAAPEGIRFLRRRHPLVWIVVAAVDGGLNNRAYVELPGVGDAGAQACGDLVGNFGSHYADNYWVKPQILSSAAAQLVLDRTASELCETA